MASFEKAFVDDQQQQQSESASLSLISKLNVSAVPTQYGEIAKQFVSDLIRKFQEDGDDDAEFKVIKPDSAGGSSKDFPVYKLIIFVSISLSLIVLFVLFVALCRKLLRAKII